MQVRSQTIGERVRRTPVADRGMTLVEVLVVLFIIGIVLGFATLSFKRGGVGGVVEQEISRLRALVELSGQKAIIEAREFGLAFSKGGYRFLELQDDGWHVLGDTDVLRARHLPDGLYFGLVIDDSPVALSEDVEEIEAGAVVSNDQLPQVVFLTDGSAMDFEVTVFSNDLDTAFRLLSNADGELYDGAVHPDPPV